MVKLLNPAMTLTNIEGEHWLVGFDHDFGGGEHISLTVRVSKSRIPIQQIEREAFDRATELLQVVSSRIDPDT